MRVVGARFCPEQSSKSAGRMGGALKGAKPQERSWEASAEQRVGTTENRKVRCFINRCGKYESGSPNQQGDTMSGLKPLKWDVTS
jgi:hypothetical protein